MAVPKMAMLEYVGEDVQQQIARLRSPERSPVILPPEQPNAGMEGTVTFLRVAGGLTVHVRNVLDQ